jgi:lipopolysaccharide/colanic/teichoic acid biosynthesis glycosyltransferase
LASLKYSAEASILGQSENPEREYLGRLLPDKIRLAKEYIQRSSLLFDVKLIVETIIKVFGYRTSAGHISSAKSKARSHADFRKGF